MKSQIKVSDITEVARNEGRSLTKYLTYFAIYSSHFAIYSLYQGEKFLSKTNNLRNLKITINGKGGNSALVKTR